jgi:L-iditol 2-dehydrogenase
MATALEAFYTRASAQARLLKSVILRKGQSAEDTKAEVAEMPVPQIGRGELLVEMKACGLCGTDVEKLRGEYTAAMPVLGHEAVGVVAKVGAGSRLKEGDRVFPHHHVSCGECYYCRRGSETMCDRYKTSNLDPGGFSQYFRVPEWNVSHGGVLKLPPNLGFSEASLIEPVACCLRALDKCMVQPDDAVLVVGAGPVGLTHSLLLRTRGAKVLISDISDYRLRFAEERKAGLVIDASKADVPAEVRRITDGRGADLAIAASGSKKAILQALQAVRKGGRVCIFGVPPRGSVLEYDISDPYNAEVSILSSYGASDRDTANALAMITGRAIDFASLITHTFRIEDFGRAVETVTGGVGMKVVVEP